ncbi:hypothetical protein H1R17_05365 [Flavobacterium sp. xlx-214]|uniref:hypothetical protein n=1 Tax=unclassified Flavobacterium TaxID=196869 RepID=UPI0013D10DF9|nr:MULTISPECIES: hypothetical protein [unclassified Flavobacterium]MBA5793632.1 hypothetical protein [Flavobacterium sp. xlx-221]QMI84561.1 hypothetical protein H1R17_05365 [Flavobacterium sp. xlx-214]
MNKKAIKPYIIFFSIVFFIVLIINVIKEITYSKYLIKDVEMEYKSVVIDLYNPREWIKDPTFMKLRKNNNEEIDVYLTDELFKYIAIGDSLIKIKNENSCYVKKPNEDKKHFFYRRISKEDRNHWTYPKEWKNKWMESSKWDTITRN